MWQRAQTDDDVIQDFVDFSLDWLAERRYTLGIRVDMAAWAATMREAPGMSVVNPTFDPQHSPLSPKNSFWIEVRTGSLTVATSAGRLFVTDDYFELQHSMRLWYDPPHPEHRRLAQSLPPGTPTIGGIVGHEGGLWVHPRHRKQGLSAVLPRFTRAVCLRQWDADWLTGVAQRGIGECGIAKWSYGYPHVEPCFEGYFPPTQRYERLYICYMNRDELLAGLDPQTLPWFQPDGDQQMADAAARMTQG
jgi:hypothetical protein